MSHPASMTFYADSIEKLRCMELMCMLEGWVPDDDARVVAVNGEPLWALTVVKKEGAET